MLTESIINRVMCLAAIPLMCYSTCEGEPGDKEAGLLDDCGKPTPFIDHTPLKRKCR